ncbi:MAG: zinc ribbon domain-containing protein [Bacilli bacterium]|nr:zinc ribbon domain-containing protein [Bacilli bacterium]
MADALSIIVPIFMALVFVFVIAQIVSPKFRGKMMSRQMKSVKYMMDESKDDIESISTNMANATKGGIETTARAIKKGFTDEGDIYCKHCGSKIDNDSKFCKICGKEQ